MGRAYAELLEREGKVTAAQAELKPLITARELGKTSKLKAIESLGWTLDDLQQEYLASLGGTQTPEERAARAAIQAVEAREKARLDAEKATQDQQQAAQQTEARARNNKDAQDVEAAARPILGELDAIVSQGKSAIEAMAWWYGAKKTELPADKALVLREYEQHLRAELSARGFVKSPPAVPAVTTTSDRGPAARSTTAAITPADTGEVPLRRVPNGKPLSALERSRLIMQELGITE